MCKTKKGVFTNTSGDVVAYLDDFAPVVFNEVVYQCTIRNNKCELLTNLEKCRHCDAYRNSLRKSHSRWVHKSDEDNTQSKSNVNIRFLSTPEKNKRILRNKERAIAAEKQVIMLSEKIAKLTEMQGEHLSDSLHKDILEAMKECSQTVSDTYPEGSFARLFWAEQLRAANVKNARQMRWHPLIIRWCLNLKLMSSSSYHAMRTAGFIKLPSERTLRDYSNYFKGKTGYQVEVNHELQRESKVSSLPDCRKYVTVVIDEMKVKENLVYDKHSGEIVGYTALGDINDELDAIEKRCENLQQQPDIAKHVLVIMVRGILFKLDFPLAHFAVSSLTGEQLFPIVWEGVKIIESLGLKVLCITADGASPNQKFFKMHRSIQESSKSTSEPSIVYKTENVYAENGDRWIFFVSDPPHLMKTARNCLYNSGFSGTRLTTVRDLPILLLLA